MVETSILDVIGCKANVLCTIGRMTLPKMMIRSEDRLAIKWTIRRLFRIGFSIRRRLPIGTMVQNKRLQRYTK